MTYRLNYVSSPTDSFNNFINLPTPSSINYFWNIGSILGFIIIFQILSGVFLSIHFSTSEPFQSVIHTTRNVWIGSEIRFLHSNGASIFFILIYIHISRSLINLAFNNIEVWTVGVVILLLLIGTAFLGYVLPWGQMSFWGATVITNLASAIPLLGENIVQWLWGGFSVSTPTLNRFFSLHFLLPFILASLSLIHLIFLHNTGSSNPLGSNSNQDNLNFHPFFSWNDLLLPLIIFSIIIIFSWNTPYLLIDPDNFSLANPITTPVHIQPEWYFLFAYALLRSIPNNLGGVIILLLSILSLLIIPINNENNNNSNFNPVLNTNTIIFFSSFLLLTWLGGIPIEPPYINISSIVGIFYFLSILA